MPIGVDAGVAGQSSDVPPSWPGCPAAATRREKGQLGRLSTSRPSHLRCNLRASAMFEQASQARRPAAWLCRLTQPTQLLARPCVTASASEQLPPLERTSAFEATAGRLGTPAMGAEQSAPSGAERPLQRSYNGPTYGGVGRDTAVRGSRRNYGLPCSGVGSATGENQQSERRVDGGVLNRWRSTGTARSCRCCWPVLDCGRSPRCARCNAATSIGCASANPSLPVFRPNRSCNGRRPTVDITPGVRSPTTL